MVSICWHMFITNKYCCTFLFSGCVWSSHISLTICHKSHYWDSLCWWYMPSQTNSSKKSHARYSACYTCNQAYDYISSAMLFVTTYGYEILRHQWNVHVQLDSRAAEIERLTKLLDGGRPHDVVALEARNRSNERLISHLNIQVICKSTTYTVCVFVMLLVCNFRSTGIFCVQN